MSVASSPIRSVYVVGLSFLSFAGVRCYDRQPYRDEAGSVVSGAITLRLADFLPYDLAVNFATDDRDITIPNEILKEALDVAEASLASTISRYRTISPLGGMVVESDSSVGSPAAEMTSTDESLRGAREALAEQQAEERNSSYEEAERN